MFSFWSSTLQNIYMYIYTHRCAHKWKERKETQTNPLWKLNYLSAFFCFQMMILVLSLELVLQCTRDSESPTTVLHCRDSVRFLSKGKGVVLMQTRTSCYWFTLMELLWKHSKGFWRTIHHIIKRRHWTELSYEYSSRKSLKEASSST